jgi:hypothetical protein
VAPVVLGPTREPPAYALSSSVVFYLERALATFLLSYVLLAVVVRSVIRGELPSAISREGLTWPDEVSGATKEALEALKTEFEILEHDVHEIAERAVLRTRLPRVLE